MSTGLYRAIAKSVSGRLSTYVIQFVSLAVYARLFTPAEFGIIASIQVFVIFFQLLADVGIGPAIINENSFEKNKRDGVFTVTALLGGALALIFYLFSYFLNYFYGGYEYQSIALFVTVAIFFSSLNTVPITAMNKDARFINIAFIDIVVECTSLVAVYTLYFYEWGLLALAARPAIQSVLKFFLIWFASKNTEIGRAFFGRELYHIKAILRFSIYQFGFNFINYFSRNLDNILVAKYFGMSSVGIYEKAYQLMRYPLLLTTYAMTPAIQPILTKYRDDSSIILKEHNLLTSRLLALSVPISVFIYLNSYNVVLFLLGSQWLNVVPLIEIFCFMIPIQAILSTCGSFFQVMNKPNILFYSGCLSAFVNVGAISLGIYSGDMNILASFLVISFAINFLQAYFILFKFCFKNGLMAFYKILFRTLCSIFSPLFLYFLIKKFLFIDFEMVIMFDLFVNFSTMIFLFVLFIKPIKNAIGFR